MKHIYILAFLIIVKINVLEAQVSSIVAGNITGNSTFYDYSPDIEFYAEEEMTSFYIDVNNDSIDDFYLSITHVGVQGMNFRSVDITAIDNGKVSAQYYQIDSVEGTCQPFEIAICKKYIEGDTINLDTTFISTPMIYLNVDNSRFECFDYNFNDWNDSEDMFIAFSIDDILGWIRVREVTYQSIIIDSYFYNSLETRAPKIIQNSETTIYPNPANGKITIQTENLEKIEIFDIKGEILLSSDADKKQLDLSSFSKGIYFIKIRTINGVAIEKIILN